MRLLFLFVLVVSAAAIAADKPVKHKGRDCVQNDSGTVTCDNYEPPKEPTPAEKGKRPEIKKH
jgi:hypothetical protein